MLRKIVVNCLESITGISTEELENTEGLDFVKEGILDSLAIVSLLSMLEGKLDCTLETGDFSIGDFVSLDSIIKAVDTKKQKK